MLISPPWNECGKDGESKILSNNLKVLVHSVITMISGQFLNLSLLGRSVILPMVQLPGDLFPRVIALPGDTLKRWPFSRDDWWRTLTLRVPGSEIRNILYRNIVSRWNLMQDSRLGQISNILPFSYWSSYINSNTACCLCNIVAWRQDMV